MRRLRNSLVTLGLALGVSACLWRGYDKIINVHLDVLTHMAVKLVLVVESGRLGSEGMAEYSYPAERARQFLQQFDDKHDRPSHQEMAKLLDRYEAFVKAVDAARRAPEQATATPEWMHTERDALWEQAAKIRADVEAGR